MVDQRSYDGTFTETPTNSALGIGVKTNDTGDEADPGCCAAYWNGLIDDLGLWNRALTEAEITDIYTKGLAGVGIVGGASAPGDFDANGTLDAADIDALSAEARAGTNTTRFDLNNDAKVDDKDRTVWVETLKRTYFGDANLDGEFNSGDLVGVFQVGEYEDATAMNSTWSDGDFDGSGDFDSTDFVSAFQGGGFEKGPRAAVAAVPEPSTLSLLALACGGLLFGSRRRR
jgi:hypothetical protein